MKRLLTITTIFVLFTAPQFTFGADVDDFFNQYMDEFMRLNPEYATILRYFSGEEQDRIERQLSPRTLDHQIQNVALAKKYLKELPKFNRSEMTNVQKISTEVMEWQMKSIMGQEQFLDYKFPLNQLDGANVDLVTMMTVGRSIITERDADNYVAALAQVAARMDEAIFEARRIAEKDIIPPKFILKETIEQMKSFIKPAYMENPFVATLVQKMSEMEAVPGAKRKKLLSEAEKIVSGDIYPAWKRGIAMLESQVPDATDDAGLWRLKGGDKAYQYYLRSNTTTDLTPDQIHEIGLKKVKEIETRMDGLFRRIGYTEGSINERVEQLRKNLEYPNPTSAESRERIIRDLEEYVRDAEKRAEALFDKKPKSKVIVQPTPTFQEQNDSARCWPPAMDGSRPSIFLFPRRLSYMNSFGMRTLVYHETVPGHHYQVSLQMENRELPRYRRLFSPINAYVEGWALYAEKLAAESGWYEDDIEGLLGQLNDELFRARRLVVDTGLHAKHWTRQQAIDYGIEESEVDRYIVDPGQACSYMIGQLKLLELRNRANKTLGDRFSIRDFHNLVLETGAVPLNVLEKLVDDYISSNEALDSSKGE